MTLSNVRCLLRRSFDAKTLFATSPPVFAHPHKRLAFELACTGTPPRGTIEVTRWAALALPATATLATTDIVAVPGFYDYAEIGATSWHLNFTDPRLFVAYGSRLLAQDELQAVEHPALGALREALGDEAITEEAGAATPVLVAGVERRCVLDTAPCPARPYGLYGNQFARAPSTDVRAALRVLIPPPHTNLIAIAAPSGSGPYWRKQLEAILAIALTGFAAAKQESRGTVEICTGFWGCGAFGGNRRAMTLLQLLAARLAGIDRLRFFTGDTAEAFEAGADDLASIDVAPDEPLADVLDRIDDLDYEWGTSDGT
jgi:hypothetical protein